MSFRKKFQRSKTVGTSPMWISNMLSDNCPNREGIFNGVEISSRSYSPRMNLIKILFKMFTERHLRLQVVFSTRFIDRSCFSNRFHRRISGSRYYISGDSCRATDQWANGTCIDRHSLPGKARLRRRLFTFFCLCNIQAAFQFIIKFFINIKIETAHFGK